MKHVLQENEEGCGVACVAMIAGVSYWDARVAIFGKKQRYLHTTFTSDLVKGLRKLGFRSGGKLTRLGQKSKISDYRDIPQNAILKVNRRKNGSWHWIVWDAAARCTRDPLKPAYKRPRCSSFLTVNKRKP
jgi:hypothetical protein